MKQSEVKIEIRINLPAEYVFKVFTNYESYEKVPLVLGTKLIQKGEIYPGSGKNAIRTVSFIGGSLKEVVTDMQFPLYWDYQFLKWSLPVRHLGGRMQFDQTESGTLVTWSTRYDSSKLPKVACIAIDQSIKVFLLYAATFLRRIALQESSH